MKISDVVYDVRTDEHIKKIVADCIKFESRDSLNWDYGVFGTSAWYEELEKNELLHTFIGHIKRVDQDSKSTIGRVMLDYNNEEIELTIGSISKKLSEGSQFEVTLVRSKIIYPKFGRDDWFLLKAVRIPLAG